jgi:hypothetical protein
MIKKIFTSGIQVFIACSLFLTSSVITDAALQVEYAGEDKYLSEDIHRLTHRADELERKMNRSAQVYFEIDSVLMAMNNYRRYPKGTYKMEGKGKYVILPVYDKKGKKVLESQVPVKKAVDPKPKLSSKPTDKEKEALQVCMHQLPIPLFVLMRALGQAWENAEKEDQRNEQRAKRIAFDQKDPKMAAEMLRGGGRGRRAAGPPPPPTASLSCGSLSSTHPPHPPTLPPTYVSTCPRVCHLCLRLQGDEHGGVNER